MGNLFILARLPRLHAYMDICVPLIGDDSLFCRKQDTNPHDSNAFAIIREEKIVGHVPIDICTTFWRFLSLLDKRINRDDGHELEVPAQYRFLGLAIAITWTKKRVTEIEEKVNSKVTRCLKNEEYRTYINYVIIYQCSFVTNRI